MSSWPLGLSGRALATSSTPWGRSKIAKDVRDLLDLLDLDLDFKVMLDSFLDLWELKP